MFKMSNNNKSNKKRGAGKVSLSARKNRRQDQNGLSQNGAFSNFCRCAGKWEITLWPTLICSAVTGDHRNLRTLGKVEDFKRP